MGRSITAAVGVRGLALDDGLVLKAGETAVVSDEQWGRISHLAPTTITDGGASSDPLTHAPSQDVDTSPTQFAAAVAGTTLGTVVKKIQVYDADGDSLGFIAVYDAIT